MVPSETRSGQRKSAWIADSRSWRLPPGSFLWGEPTRLPVQYPQAPYLDYSGAALLTQAALCSAV
jgi:hypothetical protein